MKRLLLSTLFTLFAVAAFAQKGTVTGTVVDAETGETVAGAVLEFSPAGAPDKKQYSTSGFKGAVSIPSLAYGEYKLVVSFPNKFDIIQNLFMLFFVSSDLDCPNLFVSA